MRRLVAARDSGGRSFAREVGPVDFEGRAGTDFAVATLYAAAAGELATQWATGVGEAVDLAVAPGSVRWIVVRYVPDQAFPMHHTETTDLDVVLEGTIELGLDDGTHHLRTGDCVVIEGVDHSWRAGPEGCVLSVMSIGTGPG